MADDELAQVSNSTPERCLCPDKHRSEQHALRNSSSKVEDNLVMAVAVALLVKEERRSSANSKKSNEPLC